MIHSRLVMNSIIFHLMKIRLGDDFWSLVIISNRNSISRELTEALGAIDIPVLVSIEGRVAGNGAEWLPIAIEHLGMEEMPLSTAVAKTLHGSVDVLFKHFC